MKGEIIIGVIIITMFVMLAIAPSAGHWAQNDVKPDSTGTGCSSVTYLGKDILGLTVYKGFFSASWAYSYQNGNLVKEYTPKSTAHATVPVVTWMKVDKPHWANTGKNTYCAYGNVVFRVGVWYIAFPEYYHAAVQVTPHSYGSGSASYGSGEFN